MKWPSKAIATSACFIILRLALLRIMYSSGQEKWRFLLAATNPERLPPVRRAGLDRLQDSSPYVPVQGGVKDEMKEPRCGEDQIRM